MEISSEFKRIAFIFPGQGAQYPQMAKDFVDHFSAAREVFEEADDCLERSISSVILNGPLDLLTQTQNSQVAIYITGMAILRVVQELVGIQPFVCAGLSLGEYTALTAAGWLSFSETLSLVDYRGKFMSQACENTKGSMAVVMGLETETIEACVQDLHLSNDLWISNYNCPGQIVISGTIHGIAMGVKALQELGAKRVLPISVHGAFHSPLMRQAEIDLAPFIRSSRIKKSETQLVMNVPGDFVSDLVEMRDNLIRQVTQPVRWEQGIRVMETREVDLYIEFGPGQTLKGLNRWIGVKAPTIAIDKIHQLEQLARLKEEGKIA